MFSRGVPAFITPYKAIISYRNYKIQGNFSSGSVFVRAKKTLSFKWLGSSALPTEEPPSRRATKILDYERSPFFLSPSSEIKRARLENDHALFSRLAALPIDARFPY